MKTLNNIIITVLFIGFIFGFGLMIWLHPDKEISEVENRTLAQRPVLDPGNIVNGEYMTQFENYITDQFFLRDTWIEGYMDYQILTNQTFINGYYIVDDWVYPEPFTEVDEKAIRNAAEKVNELNEFTKERGMELFYFSLPDRRYMLDIQYPFWVEESVGQADKQLLLSLFPDEHLKLVDIEKEWQGKWTQDDYDNFYFRTDHHWDMDGALAGYEVIRNSFHQLSEKFPDTPFQREAYNLECPLTDRNFLGSYNRQLYNYIDSASEEMCYAIPTDSNMSDWTVYLKGMGEENLREFSYIYGNAVETDKETVTYSDVYVSDFNEIHIINPAKEKAGTKVLFLKDSYANPLLPLVADNFYQTTYYDVRHNKDRNLYEFIEQHDFDIVAFLYSDGRTLDYLYDFGEAPK
ncbi:DHHW family protein [Ornithinibacillus scapharcae]|uniref:DHHW family protein n=1 Tax=Ornithinibacillus scapharcae TaxID=1147159 RepID=UPI000225B9C2|nr:DHHW family protein [Ornithinibacillus scapharcae]